MQISKKVVYLGMLKKAKNMTNVPTPTNDVKAINWQLEIDNALLSEPTPAHFVTLRDQSFKWLTGPGCNIKGIQRKLSGEPCDYELSSLICAFADLVATKSWKGAKSVLKSIALRTAYIPSAL